MISILVTALFSLALSLPPQDASPPSQSANTAQSSGAFDQLAQTAKQAREEDRDDSAIDSYRQALLLKPEWDEGLWYLGTLLYKKENYFEACTVLRRFLAQNPGNGYGWAMLGLSEFESHDYTRALDHLQQSMIAGLGDNKNMRTTVSYVIAILLTRSEQFDESMDLLLARVASGEDTSPLVEPLGLSALRLPFLPAEIPADRREMIRMAGEAVLALEEQRNADADKLFDQLEAAYPDQPGVHFLIGVHLLDSRPEDAIKELKREIEISPSHVPARLRLADQYIKQQNVDLGLQYAQEALKLAPKSASAHMVLGEGLIAKGDAAGGMRELETARDASPDMVRVHWDLVRAYTAAGRVADADREKSEIERISKQDEAR
jgi:tetratricopeptide (TPR) repeat protein